MWIDRGISTLLTRLSAQRPALVLTGARQAGKTSLLKRLYPEHRFVTLDLPAEAAASEEDPQTFLRRNPPPLLVDEVQYAPGLFRHVKTDIDAHRKHFGRFILTGSQKFLLMKEVSDSLAGRAAIVELETLSWVEIHAAMPDWSLESVVVRGGYPELYDEPTLDASEYYRSYLATYLERDVRALMNVGSLRDFERFIRVCAARSGQLLNKADLARDVGVSAPTANAWLSVLAASNQIFLLEPWFANTTKSMVKTPKLYWSDSGFLAWLLGITEERELERSPYAGAIWETFVYSELRKRQTAAEGGPSLYFYRDRGHEVDFLIHRGGFFELMEAKWTGAPTPRDAAGLSAVAQRLGADKVLRRRVLCRTERPYPVGEAQAVGPADAWFDREDQPGRA